MAKVTISGEVFEWDASRKPMTEALAIEAALKCRYADWETELAGGQARALCGFIWMVWRRAGRDIDLDDILSGKVPIDLNEVSIETDEPDPTPPLPDLSNTTGSDTSASSPKSSEYDPGSSGSSTNPTSRRSSTTSKISSADDAESHG